MAAVTGGIMAGASLLGAAATSSAERQAGKDKAKAAEAAAQRIAEQIQQARLNIQQLTPAIEANILAGTQAGLGTLKQGLGQRMQAFQGGNVAAQNLIRQGMPQYQAALLGLGMPQAPQTYQQQLPQINYQMPQFVSTVGLMEGETRAAQPASEMIQQAQAEQAAANQAAATQQPVGGIPATIADLPQFTKSDFYGQSRDFASLESNPTDAIRMKTQQAKEVLSRLTPDEIGSIKRQGPSSLGLGGDQGTVLFNLIMEGF